NRGLNQVEMSFQRFTAIAEQNESFENVGSYAGDTMNLTGAGEPAQLAVMRFSAGVMEALKVKPAIGRNFSPDEGRRGGPLAAILSDTIWDQRYFSDPGILGKAISLDGASYTIVGVMPHGFAFPDKGIDVWVPRPFELTYLTQETVERGAGFLNVIGRLKPAVTRQHAQTELEAIATRYAPPNRLDSDLGIVTVPLPEQVTGSARPTLLVLMAAVVFVLLIACANVANLLLAKAVVRQKEMAVRSALGAGRRRLIRQLLTESVMLALIAGGLGVLFALWGVRLLVSSVSGAVPRSGEITVDGKALLFTVAIAVLTGLIFGLAPVYQIWQSDLTEALKSEGRGATGGASRNRTRTAFVVIAVALSLILLVGAGLMMKSFLSLRSVNPGFNPANLLVANINLPQSKYHKAADIAEFYRRLVENADKLPGAVSAAAVQAVPLGTGNSRTMIAIDGRPLPPIGQRPIVFLNIITPDYFKTMGIPILEGRVFTEQDNATAPVAVIINQSFAKRFFPGERPIGKRVLMGQNQPREIVGVVGDVREVGLDQAPSEGFYLSAEQRPEAAMSVVVKTAVPPLSLGEALSANVLEIDRDQPVANLRTMDQVVSSSISNRRLTLVLLGVFAAVALVLAGIGIYSVMAYSVTQRTREIGLRLALGAESRDVMKLIIGDGLIMALIGVGLGLAGAFALTRLMVSLLFGVSATDPVTFAAIPIMLIAVAALASFFPARRALKVGPVIALRDE
ncbi:MAG: ABC transporter permease, partial [Blastocatellia bacterium]